MEDILALMFLAVMAVIALAMYMLPGIIASNRDHENTATIWVLTFLFGWVGVPWWILLIWAIVGSKRRES